MNKIKNEQNYTILAKALIFCVPAEASVIDND